METILLKILLYGRKCSITIVGELLCTLANILLNEKL